MQSFKSFSKTAIKTALGLALVAGFATGCTPKEPELPVGVMARIEAAANKATDAANRAEAAAKSASDAASRADISASKAQAAFGKSVLK